MNTNRLLYAGAVSIAVHRALGGGWQEAVKSTLITEVVLLALDTFFSTPEPIKTNK